MARLVCIYGDSGSYKTTQLKFAARYVYEQTGKPIRMVTAENHQPIDGLVQAGIVDLLEFTTDIQNPLPFLAKLCKGWWYQDKAGQRVLTQGKPEDWANIGAYFVEGASSISDVLMKDCRDKGRKISEEIVGKFMEDGLTFGAPAKAHYGFVQSVMLDRIVDLGQLPVPLVILTAHEAEGTEQDTRKPIRGPALVGKAGTAKIAPKLGTMIHLEKYNSDESRPDPSEKGKSILVKNTKVRGFFQSHPDESFGNVTYPAKPRVASELIPELLKRWPGGYFEPTLSSGLDDYLRLEDQLMASGLDADIQWKQAMDAQRKAKS